MDLLVEALKAVGLIVGVVAVVIITPLIFMLVFSIASGVEYKGPHEDE